VTESDLAVLVRTIGPMIREFVTKAISDITPRLAAAEATIAALGDVRDRVIAVETKAAIPVLPLPPEAGYDDLRTRIVMLEARPPAPDVIDLRERLASLERRLQDDGLTKDMAALRERVAVLEVKPVTPGPQGEPGPAGKDGTPGLSYEGVYQDGKEYEIGQIVTWAGSTWHCNETTTTKPGDASKAWTLMVKRGRDGKDGKDAPALVPVVALNR